MIPLINLSQAKRHLHLMLDDTSHDEDLYMKIGQASEIVADYIKSRSLPVEWEIGTSPQTYDVPALIQAAVLLVAGELYLNRESTTVDVLSPAVCSLLQRYRTPSIA